MVRMNLFYLIMNVIRRIWHLNSPSIYRAVFKYVPEVIGMTRCDNIVSRQNFIIEKCLI